MMYKLNAALAATLALAASASSANAAVFVFNAGTTVYTQNFDTLTSAGTFATLPAGVLATETGTNANGAYAIGTGSSNAGDTYSFGAAGSSDRALGGLRSGNLVPLFGFGFTNNTGREITGLAISFTGEQWRLGANNRADRLDFQYALGTSTLTTGTFVDLNALDFASPTTTGGAGAKNGNAPAFRTTLSGSVTGLTLGNGQSFAFRFVDFDPSGADDGLAVDDFSLALTLAPAVTPVPEPASWALMIGGFALIGASVRRRSARTVLA